MAGQEQMQCMISLQDGCSGTNAACSIGDSQDVFVKLASFSDSEWQLTHVDTV